MMYKKATSKQVNCWYHMFKDKTLLSSTILNVGVDEIRHLYTKPKKEV